MGTDPLVERVIKSLAIGPVRTRMPAAAARVSAVVAPVKPVKPVKPVVPITAVGML